MPINDQGIPKLRPPLLWFDEIEGRRQIFVCRHCENPICVDACVAGALWVDTKSGMVRVHQNRCIGCYSCVMECPFGAVRIVYPVEEPSTNGVVYKCDGCIGWQAPLCAIFCPTGALQTAKNAPERAAKRRRERAMFVSLATGTVRCAVKKHG